VLRTSVLRFDGGSVAGLWQINPFQGSVRDPGYGYRGKIVWSHVLRFRVLMGG
jgi:hypothetical protein